MCGEIRKSPDAETAVEWAIAYAKSFEFSDDFQRGGDPLPNESQRRAIAMEFISDFVPAGQRDAAHQLLHRRPDPLDSSVRYWTDVVDQSVNQSYSRLMDVVGTKWHDTYSDYARHKDDLSRAEQRRNWDANDDTD